ncbi:MAG: gliding motility-associated C-terminal domain-containing protein [Bacteroidia bacterium]
MNKLLFLFIALTLASIKGFSNIASLKKNKNDSIKIVVPNIFTPNNDGKNDTWSMIVINGLEIFDLQTNIYNRFGKQVFESTNTVQNWNGYNLYEGSLCSDGAYFYVISYTDGNTNETKTLKGFIEIIK